MLTGKVADTSEESTQVVSIDLSLVVSVNTSESRSKRVVVPDFEVMSEDILCPGKAKFALNHGSQALLDVNGESVKAADANISTVETHVAENIVLAGKHHLRKAINK